MTVTRVQRLDPFPADAYRGTFAAEDDAVAAAEGVALPPGWEGVYFPYDAALVDLREDGSPARDGVLPEFDLPRRMYAGEDAVYHRPLRLGDVVEQTVRAGSVVEETGRSGRLVFADVVREYRIGGELAVESVWHDVFLEGGRSLGARRPRGSGRRRVGAARRARRAAAVPLLRPHLQHPSRALRPRLGP